MEDLAPAPFFGGSAPEDKDKFNCLLATLLLTDAGQAVDIDSISAVIGAAGGRIQNAGWVSMFAQSLAHLDVKALITSAFVAPVAGTNNTAPAGRPNSVAAAPVQAAPAVVDEPVDIGMDDISLFD